MMVSMITSLVGLARARDARPFYENQGNKKSTGIRKSWSFDGYGLSIQPMRKVIK